MFVLKLIKVNMQELGFIADSVYLNRCSSMLKVVSATRDIKLIPPNYPWYNIRSHSNSQVIREGYSVYLFFLNIDPKILSNSMFSMDH